MSLDVERLVVELTLEEKAALVSGRDFWHTVPVDRLGIPSIMCADGPHGLRAQMEGHDHGGLLGSVPATCFPTASALASTWDTELVHAVGVAIAAEARRWQVSIVLGPGVNMKRSPLCGRNFEYLSEDPFLAGELGLAMVQGIQSYGVGTSVKHYAANNQEDDRLRVSADVDERTLREIYLPAFERIVTAGDPWTVMCAYNRVNGTHASQHEWLLTTILRDEWGWEGVVVSDWGAVHDRVAAVAAGLDWEMPPDLERSPAAVVAAVRSGTLDETLLDRSVRRMLALVDKGMAVLGVDERFDADAHHALARRAAGEAAVLLKNDGALLPIDPAGHGSIAVIGEFARTPRFQGAGSSQVNPIHVEVALDEITAIVGEGRVAFAPGYRIGRRDTDDDMAQLIDDAVAAAASADTVVCFLGLPAHFESEGFDRTHIRLPDAQLRLIAAVAAANPRVVVVLVNGSTVEMATWVDHAPAVLECWLGGQAAGGGIADVLTGRTNPGGRLAETVPVRLEDVPSSLNFPGDSGVARYGEGIFIGYRAHDRLGQDVVFPFGHGLSFTQFSITELDLSVRGAVDAGLTVTVSATVTNTGPVAGSHVVQVYVGDDVASVVRPPRELKGFAKVRLEPGASERVAIDLDQRAFSFWSTGHGRWVVEPGAFTVFVGSSSRDLPLTATIELDAPSLAAPLTRMSTLHEWLADERGGALLAAMFADDPVMRSEGFIEVVGTMPMDTLAGFPGIGFTHAQLDDLIGRL